MKTNFTNTALLTIILTTSSFAHATKYWDNPKDNPKDNPTTINNYVKPEITNVNKPEFNNKNYNDNYNKNIIDNSNKNLIKSSNTQSQTAIADSKSNAFSNSESNALSNGESNVDINNVGNSSTSIPRQAPMAYAPPAMVGVNPYICQNIASFGASSPFGGISMGIPLTSENCPLFVMHDLLMRRGETVSACEILNGIPEIADVRRRTNFSCVQQVVVRRVENDSNWLADFNRRFPPINHTLDSVHREQMQK